MEVSQAARDRSLYCRFRLRRCALIVELDGGQHLEQVTQDEERTRRLAALGYRVLRFWNDEILKNTEAVLGVILEALARAAPHPNPLPEGERE